MLLGLDLTLSPREGATRPNRAWTTDGGGGIAAIPDAGGLQARDGRSPVRSLDRSPMATLEKKCPPRPHVEPTLRTESQVRKRWSVQRTLQETFLTAR
jgi:hypothetical protein